MEDCNDYSLNLKEKENIVLESIKFSTDDNLAKMEDADVGVDAIRFNVNSPSTSEYSSMETSVQYHQETDNLKDDVQNDSYAKNNGLTSSLGSRIASVRCYACTKCERTFSRRDELNIHYTHTHRERPRYACDVCELVFMVKRELSTHVRIHKGEQPQRCKECGMEFGTRQLLNKHNMVHTGVRSHYCPLCPQAFFQKGHLTQHMQIHAGVRPHKCELCVKTFIFKFDLNRHMKIHAERGSNSCQRCGKGFTKSSSLEEHVFKCKKMTESSINAKKHSTLAKRRHEESACTSAKQIKLDCVEKNFAPTLTNQKQASQTPKHFVDPMTANFSEINATNLFQQSMSPSKPPLDTNLISANFNHMNKQQQAIFNPRLLAAQNFANLLLKAAAANAMRNCAPNNQSTLTFQNFTQNFNHDKTINNNSQNSQQHTLNPPLLSSNLLLNFMQSHFTTVNSTPVKNTFAENEKNSHYFLRQNTPLNCLICGLSFANQATYLIHLSTVHFKNVHGQQKHEQQQSNSEDEKKQRTIAESGGLCTTHNNSNNNLTLFMDPQFLQNFMRQQSKHADELSAADSATTSSSSCASSPQKVSPLQFEDLQQITTRFQPAVLNNYFDYQAKNIVSHAQHKEATQTAEKQQSELKSSNEQSTENLCLENTADELQQEQQQNQREQKIEYQKLSCIQQNVCQRCGAIACARECILERELSAARNEVDRLRHFMQRLVENNAESSKNLCANHSNLIAVNDNRDKRQSR